MNISVVIPTYNNASMLATTLSAFERVHFPKDAELIVVDNNSTDDTAETINTFVDKLPVRYAFEPRQGISAAKNRGIDTARGKLLVFTDDDVRPCPEWLTIYSDEYRNSPQGFFWGGPIVSEFEGPMPSESLLRYAPESVKGLDYGSVERSLEENECFISANIALPSHAIVEVGGYSTALGLNAKPNLVLAGEETDLQKRLRSAGYNCKYLPSASIQHVVPARKCTLEHIAARIEAHGRYQRSNVTVEETVRTLAGVPLWRYRRCAERFSLAWLKRISGRDWYRDYISYRLDKGFLLGIPGRAVKDQD